MRTRLLPMVALTLLGCSRPDVIFITVDTLRVDHVGAFADGSPALTPHMDDLARDGVVTHASGPETLGGVASGDPFHLTVALDPAAITGHGAETAVPESLALAIGTAAFDEDDHDAEHGALEVLLQDGRLVGLTFRARLTAGGMVRARP